MSIDTTAAEKYEKSDDWENALKEYIDIHSKNPQEKSIISKVGWCYSRIGNYDKAIEFFKMLVEKESSVAKWHYMVGYQYYMKKDWTTAIDWFKSAVSRYPNYFVARYRLGYALIQNSGTMKRLQNKDYLEAFRQFEACESIWECMSEKNRKDEGSTYADICFQKGKIYLERRDWINAEKYFKNAFNIKDDRDIRYEYAKSIGAQNRYKDALDLIENIESTYYIDRLKGQLYIKLGQTDKAIIIYKKLSEKRKKDFIFRELAELYLLINDNKSAYQNALKSIEIGKRNHKNHHLLSRLYFNMGLIVKAKEEAEKAITLRDEQYSSDYPEARALLNKIIGEIEDKGIKSDDETTLRNMVSSISNEVLSGVISSYKQDKGFGFIRCEDGSYFFHISEILPDRQGKKPDINLIKPGLRLRFTPVQTEKGPCAKKITIEL